MHSTLTPPLAVALVLSYTALTMLVLTAMRIRRMPIGRVQTLLWVSLAVGATSIALRTVTFATG